jgi:hypothetical protein
MHIYESKTKGEGERHETWKRSVVWVAPRLLTLWASKSPWLSFKFNRLHCL